MKKFLFPFLCIFAGLMAHEDQQNQSSWMQAVGIWHPIFLHFPIALISMACLSEFLYYQRNNILYEHATKFMLVMAAIFAIPTALTGWVFSMTMHYNEAEHNLLEYHESFGGFSSSIAVILPFLKASPYRKLYLFSLGVAFVCIIITGALGGELTW